MDIYLVVFDTKATRLGEKLYPWLEAYIDHNYVKEEYGDGYFGSKRSSEPGYDGDFSNAQMVERPIRKNAKAKRSETLQADKKVEYEEAASFAPIREDYKKRHKSKRE